jgi:hypothetical protein
MPEPTSSFLMGLVLALVILCMGGIGALASIRALLQTLTRDLSAIRALLEQEQHARKGSKNGTPIPPDAPSGPPSWQ